MHVRLLDRRTEHFSGKSRRGKASEYVPGDVNEAGVDGGDGGCVACDCEGDADDEHAVGGCAAGVDGAERIGWKREKKTSAEEDVRKEESAKPILTIATKVHGKTKNVPGGARGACGTCTSAFPWRRIRASGSTPALRGAQTRA